MYFELHYFRVDKFNNMRTNKLACTHDQFTTANVPLV